MIKLFIAFSIFLSFVLKSQSIEKALSKEKAQEESRNAQIKLHQQLTSNFSNLNYNPLIQLILQDIDFSQLKSENLIFYYRNLCNERRGITFPDEEICYANTQNPAFNQTNFLKKKTINFLIKHQNKNVIPRLQNLDRFITDKNNDESNFYYSSIAKKLINSTKRQSKGIYIEEYTDHLQKKQTTKSSFYYYSINKDTELTLRKIDGQTNYNTLYLSFANLMDKIVLVRFIYNPDNSPLKENIVYKAYQFKENKWIKIPVTDEMRIDFE